MWWIYWLLAAFFAALTTIVAKVGLTDVAPNLTTAVQTVVIVLMAWGIVLVTGETAGLHTISRRSLFFLILSAVASSLSWMCYFQALQTGLASSVAGIDKTSLVMTLVLAALFLGEPLVIKSVAGIALDRRGDGGVSVVKKS